MVKTMVKKCVRENSIKVFVIDKGVVTLNAGC